MAIQSFGDLLTKNFFIEGSLNKGIGWATLSSVVRRKLDMIHYATLLSDLKSPPGNRLEPLKGKLSGFHSIRINDQWRIIFRWGSNGPEKVQVVDYH